MATLRYQFFSFELFARRCELLLEMGSCAHSQFDSFHAQSHNSPVSFTLFRDDLNGCLDVVLAMGL